MTSPTRRRARRSQHHPAVIIAAAAAGLALVVLVLHVLGWILATAALAVIAYQLGRNGRPVTRARAIATPAPQLAQIAAERDQIATQLGRITAERDQLEARAADLARQLEHQAAGHRAECAQLTDAMHAAWDAAASVRPRPAPPGEPEHDPAITAMLADPLSGVRHLGTAH